MSPVHQSHARWRWPGKVYSYMLLGISIGFPLVLVFHSVLSTRELREMRAIYLRDRAANIAARLELMAPEQLQRKEFDDLMEGDPALVRIQVFRPSDRGNGSAALEAIRSGRELYRTEEIGAGRDAIFRAYIPFHSAAEVNVAQIDLAAAAPDFILVHARHNQLIAILSGSVLLVISFYAIWSTRRAARFEIQQVETERLAQLGLLSATLAHEIRNPLGAIKGFAQLAREHASPRQEMPLNAIVRESLRLEALVNALLLYGRPQNPVVSATEWESLATDLAAQAREAIGDRPIRFRCDSRIRNISTDPDLLKQALLNLIRNSIEAMPEGSEGTVSLCAAPARDGTPVISVEDDGVGIPEQVRARLFAPFVTTKASGTGLGLPISKKLVESLGGRLEMTPLDPHGTRAELTFYGTTSGN
jgi:signal transduction histidine kinase